MSQRVKITAYDEVMKLSDEQLSALYDQLENDPNPQFELAESDEIQPQKVTRLRFYNVWRKVGQVRCFPLANAWWSPDYWGFSILCFAIEVQRKKRAAGT